MVLRNTLGKNELSMMLRPNAKQDVWRLSAALRQSFNRMSLANHQSTNIDRKSFGLWLDKELLQPSPRKGLFKGIKSIHAIEEEQHGLIRSLEKQTSENIF